MYSTEIPSESQRTYLTSPHLCNVDIICRSRPSNLPSSSTERNRCFKDTIHFSCFAFFLSPPPLHYDTMDCVQKMSTSPTCPRVESRKVGRFPNLGQKYPRLSWSLDLNLYSWVGSLKSSYLLSILIKVRQSLAAEASGVV